MGPINITYDVNIWTLLTGIMAFIGMVWFLGKEFAKYTELKALPKQIESLRSDLSSEISSVKDDVSDKQNWVLMEMHQIKERLVRVESDLDALKNARR